MSELGIRILKILHDKDSDEYVYLKSHSELRDFDRQAIQTEAERLTEEGYLVTVRTDQMIELDNSLVNYFFEITDTGKSILTKWTKNIS